MTNHKTPILTKAQTVFRPSATKSGRPHGVMYMSSWGTPSCVWGGAGGAGAQPGIMLSCDGIYHIIT